MRPEERTNALYSSDVEQLNVDINREEGEREREREIGRQRERERAIAVSHESPINQGRLRLTTQSLCRHILTSRLCYTHPYPVCAIA